MLALVARDAARNALKRKSPPAKNQLPQKKLRFAPADAEDSVTESESEPSETESEMIFSF